MVKHVGKSKGFSLIEMAVVLVIVGLIIGGGFSTVGAYLDNAKQSHTMGNLKVTKQALLNYVKVNKHMPCPDQDDDGTQEDDRVGSYNTRCSGELGTIPYDDLGISREIASDDYGNLFGYAIHKESAVDVIMDKNPSIQSELDDLIDDPGAYFYNKNAPVFDLDTPPTADPVTGVDNATLSYTICKKEAGNSCSGTSDVELEFIPAVVIAYNENGSATQLGVCTGPRGDRETQNCDMNSGGNPTFTKGYFEDSIFDDQLVTISAYEIKEYALGDFSDPPDAGDNTPSTPLDWDNFKHIINKDLDSTNEYNNASSDAGEAAGADGVFDDIASDVYGDSLFVSGDIHKSIEMQSGSNKLYVAGSVGNTVGGGNDHDYIFINGSLLGFDSDIGTGTISTQDGDDVVYINESIGWKANLNLADGNDFAQIGGQVIGQVLGGNGNDTVFIEGSISITSNANKVDLGAGDDTLFLGGILGEDDMLSGGSGTDYLYIESSVDSWEVDYQDSTGNVYDEDTFKAATGFEVIYYGQSKESIEGQGDGTTYPKYTYDYNNIQNY